MLAQIAIFVSQWLKRHHGNSTETSNGNISECSLVTNQPAHHEHFITNTEIVFSNLFFVNEQVSRDHRKCMIEIIWRNRASREIIFGMKNPRLASGFKYVTRPGQSVEANYGISILNDMPVGYHVFDMHVPIGRLVPDQTSSPAIFL